MARNLNPEIPETTFDKIQFKAFDMEVSIFPDYTYVNQEGKPVSVKAGMTLRPPKTDRSVRVSPRAVVAMINHIRKNDGVRFAVMQLRAAEMTEDGDLE